ncbi:hypothetical protein [Porticoccus sp.]
MPLHSSSAEVLRRFELSVLIIGMAVALYILSLGAKKAFLANLSDGFVLQDVLLTAFSLVVMGGAVVSPFIMLALLGKKVSGKGLANKYQVSGFVISLLLTVLSIYLYVDAHIIVSTDRSSTAGLIFLAVPIWLCLIGGVLYGLLTFIYSRQKSANSSSY